MDDNPVICICWNCGEEIRQNDPQYFVNEEIWCKSCCEGYTGCKDNV